MLPILAGIKWTIGAVATGVAGNWLSEKIGIGSENEATTQETATHWERWGFWYISGAFILLGIHTIYTMIKRKRK